MTQAELIERYGENMSVDEVARFFKCVRDDGSPCRHTIYSWQRNPDHPIKGFRVARNRLLFETAHVYDVWREMQRGIS